MLIVIALEWLIFILMLCGFKLNVVMPSVVAPSIVRPSISIGTKAGPELLL
jgi:hypothetical protein